MLYIIIKNAFMIKRKFNKTTIQYRKHPKFNVPVIGYFKDKTICYSSIIEAEELTGINYHLIFDACIGRTTNAGFVKWEYENGIHWIKYKAKQILGKRALRPIGFNG